MASQMKIGLVGDYQDTVPAHRAIPKALDLASTHITTLVDMQWLHSTQLSNFDLSEFAGLWCVPASPYENDDDVLKTIAYARKQDIPFLGTCGGYQYAALEFARFVLGYSEAENAEVQPDTTMPLISSLSCSLYDESEDISLVPKSKIAGVYEASVVSEEYYCGYGVNRNYLHLFDGSEMCFTGFDEGGDPRCLELNSNRFYIGTAFQPERSAFKGKSHPLIRAFLSSAELFNQARLGDS